MFDLIIRGGTVVDGTGSPGVTADVGVRDGRIAAVGADLGAKAADVIDAAGAIVTPGFVDIHTHYDGQATWDQDMLPSARHGVTTAIMGIGASERPRAVRWSIAGEIALTWLLTLPGSALLACLLALWAPPRVAQAAGTGASPQVTRLIKINEYKRRQSPVGIRVTHRSFGKDWRYPITSKFRA